MEEKCVRRLVLVPGGPVITVDNLGPAHQPGVDLHHEGTVKPVAGGHRRQGPGNDRGAAHRHRYSTIADPSRHYGNAHGHRISQQGRRGLVGAQPAVKYLDRVSHELPGADHRWGCLIGDQVGVVGDQANSLGYDWLRGHVTQTIGDGDGRRVMNPLRVSTNGVLTAICREGYGLSVRQIANPHIGSAMTIATEFWQICLGRNARACDDEQVISLDADPAEV